VKRSVSRMTYAPSEEKKEKKKEKENFSNRFVAYDV
jgi:hypothetical protein